VELKQPNLVTQTREPAPESPPHAAWPLAIVLSIALGVPLDWERRLSAAFIVSEGYGTRSSTVVTVDRDGCVTFVERSYDATGGVRGEVAFRFDAAPA
jgi:hypothetical protein